MNIKVKNVRLNKILCKISQLPITYSVYWTSLGDDFTIWIWPNNECSDKLRSQLLHIVGGKVSKERGFDSMILGKVKFDNVTICIGSWDRCTIVGEVEIDEPIMKQIGTRKIIKQVTDCDISNGRYKDLEIKPITIGD